MNQYRSSKSDRPPENGECRLPPSIEIPPCGSPLAFSGAIPVRRWTDATPNVLVSHIWLKSLNSRVGWCNYRWKCFKTLFLRYHQFELQPYVPITNLKQTGWQALPTWLLPPCMAVALKPASQSFVASSSAYCFCDTKTKTLLSGPFHRMPGGGT